ncbi:MAG TPA: acyl-CoA dehydrogenase family protein [Trebonia sp.]|jgi:alkylation response protein AidB-like acyl-CoA dehydrogenase|nr:acyl-CoA dehydrogenase family protein [Trebonia sp.]
MDIAATARRIADDVLFPAALATDASDTLPCELLDALAGAGLYGVAAPAGAGGLDADFTTMCAVAETLASGCLTTAFVWLQHHGLVRAIAAGGDHGLREKWLAGLASGQIRAGFGGGGALPRPTLRAVRSGQDWLLDGTCPFVSGWGRIDVVHVSARTPDDQVAWFVVDAVEGPSLRAGRLRLAALNATATVRLDFGQHPVTADRLTGTHPAGGATPPEVLRLHGALALGVTARCLRLLGPTPLDGELTALRAELDDLGPGTPVARAAAGELAVRAAAALMAAQGSRSLLAPGHPERLSREASFALVYALRPQSRSSLLTRLGASLPGESD